MSIDEKIIVINKIPKTVLARKLNISRQTLYNKINKKEDIDLIYSCALCINENKDVEFNLKKAKENSSDLFNKSLDEKEKNKKLSEELTLLKKKSYNAIKNYDSLKKNYQDLLHRYRNLQSMLFTYYKIYGRLGNDTKANKK